MRRSDHPVQRETCERLDKHAATERTSSMRQCENCICGKPWPLVFLRSSSVKPKLSATGKKASTKQDNTKNKLKTIERRVTGDGGALLQRLLLIARLEHGTASSQRLVHA